MAVLSSNPLMAPFCPQHMHIQLGDKYTHAHIKWYPYVACKLSGSVSYRTLLSYLVLLYLFPVFYPFWTAAGLALFNFFASVPSDKYIKPVSSVIKKFY